MADPPHFKLPNGVTSNAEQKTVMTEVCIYSYCMSTYGPFRLIVYPDNDYGYYVGNI